MWSACAIILIKLLPVWPYFEEKEGTKMYCINLHFIVFYIFVCSFIFRLCAVLGVLETQLMLPCDKLFYTHQRFTVASYAKLLGLSRNLAILAWTNRGSVRRPAQKMRPVWVGTKRFPRVSANALQSLLVWQCKNYFLRCQAADISRRETHTLPLIPVTDIMPKQRKNFALLLQAMPLLFHE